MPHRTDTRVLPAHKITKDMDDLCLDAGAAAQVPALGSMGDDQANSKATKDSKPNHLLRSSPFLISSPYNRDEHLIDLRKLPKSASLFAQALTTIKPTCKDYACTPFKQCLNWDCVLKSLRLLVDKEEGFEWQEQSFFIIEFRSTMREEASTEEQGKLDGESFAEATSSGGLLKYWYGNPDHKRRNLATCIWTNRDAALAGRDGPWHRSAIEAAPRLYEDFDVSLHSMVITDGAASWRMEKYKKPYTRSWLEIACISAMSLLVLSLIRIRSRY